MNEPNTQSEVTKARHQGIHRTEGLPSRAGILIGGLHKFDPVGGDERVLLVRIEVGSIRKLVLS